MRRLGMNQMGFGCVEGFFKRDSAPSGVKTRMRFRLALLVVLPILLFHLYAPVPAYAAWLMWADGSEFTTFGPNADITIDMGTISYMCDWIYPTADVYIVPSGSVTIGGSLTDVAGTPNVIFGASGGIFVSETIGYTAPAGRIGPGRYAVIYDECQDGKFDAGDFISPRLRGDIPSDECASRRSGDLEHKEQCDYQKGGSNKNVENHGCLVSASRIPRNARSHP